MYGKLCLRYSRLLLQYTAHNTMYRRVMASCILSRAVLLVILILWHVILCVHAVADYRIWSIFLTRQAEAIIRSSAQPIQPQQHRPKYARACCEQSSSSFFSWRAPPALMLDFASFFSKTWKPRKSPNWNVIPRKWLREGKKKVAENLYSPGKLRCDYFCLLSFDAKICRGESRRVCSMRIGDRLMYGNNIL